MYCESVNISLTGGQYYIYKFLLTSEDPPPRATVKAWAGGNVRVAKKLERIPSVLPARSDSSAWQHVQLFRTSCHAAFLIFSSLTLEPAGSMELFNFCFSGGMLECLSLIRKHSSTSAPWYTFLGNLNVVINHISFWVPVLMSVHSTVGGSGAFLFYFNKKPLWICCSLLIWLFVLLS